MTEEEAYRDLGYAIIRQAVEDYEKVLRGSSPEMQRRASTKKLYNAVISYGKTRYIFVRPDGTIIRDERLSRAKLTRIKNLLESYGDAEYLRVQKEELEEFFQSDWFDMLTPGIDAERLMKLIKRKVENGERIIEKRGRVRVDTKK